MSDIWAPVIAALGASFLTGLIALGLERWRQHHVDKNDLEDRRYRAYRLLLTRSAYILHVASIFRLTIQHRMGMQELLHTTIGRQKPIDWITEIQRLNQELLPLHEAATEVWLTGEQTAIAQANDLVVQCGQIIGLATQRGTARPKLLRGIIPDAWTKAEVEQWDQAQDKLAEFRNKLGETARKETGMQWVDLFASSELKRVAKKPGRWPWRR